jgi:uncharacterized repeat protein (TIGR01451 family)
MLQRRVLPLVMSLVAALVTAVPAGAAGTGDPAYFAPYALHEAGSDPSGVAVGDFTGDGLADVAVSSEYYFDPANDYKVFVFAQQGDGTLGAPVKLDTHAQYGDRMGLAAVDFNDDGFTDLALATAVGVELFLHRAGALVFGAMIDSPDARHVEVADMDGDGIDDLVVNAKLGGVRIFHGPLASARAPVTVTATAETEIEVADVTGDGHPDVVGYSGRTVRVSSQPIGGAFGVVASGTTNDWANGLAVGDFNGDGVDDVALTVGGNQPSAGVNVFLATPVEVLGTPFRLPSYDIPEAAEAADVNGDGADDLIVAHGGWNRAGVFIQGPAGLGAEALHTIPYASHYEPKGLAVGDVTGDGRNDIAIADYNHGLVVLRNVGSYPPPDPTPPDTFLGSGPVGNTNQTTATFSFSSNEAPVTFTCALDGAVFSACTSPVTYSGVANGSHTFRVRATDAAGNTDQTPAQRTWTVDTVTPDTTITSGPTGTVTSSSATFAFTSTESGSFGCSLDGAPFAPCSSPKAYSGLAYGAHTFAVRAADFAGNTDATPATRTWTVATPADARLALAAAPNPVRPKGTLTWTQIVNNDGPGTATGLVTTQALPAGVTYSGVTKSQGSCSFSAGTVTCSLGSIAAGGSATIRITAKVTAGIGSVLSATARVNGTSYDPNSINDSATASATVRK